MMILKSYNYLFHDSISSYTFLMNGDSPQIHTMRIMNIVNIILMTAMVIRLKVFTLMKVMRVDYGFEEEVAGEEPSRQPREQICSRRLFVDDVEPSIIVLAEIDAMHPTEYEYRIDELDSASKFCSNSASKHKPKYQKFLPEELTKTVKGGYS